MAELRKYGVQTTFYFPLIDRGQADFEITPVAHAVGDTKFDKDGAGFGNTTNAFAHRGLGIYSIVASATEMEAAHLVITIIDQTAPKAWEDQAILIDTYGNASAAHAFDLDAATQGVDVTSISTSAPAANNLEAMLLGAGAAADVDIEVRSLTVTNDVGAAVVITGTSIGLDINATAGVGMDIDGTTSGVTLDGAAGPGLHAAGTTFGFEIAATAGPALSAVSTGGHGIVAGTTNGTSDGINAYGNTTGDGLHLAGGATGHGISTQGGATSGHGIFAAGVDGDSCGILCRGEQTVGGTGCGLRLEGSPAGAGLTASGGATGVGAQFIGGATSGSAMKIWANGTNDVGLEIIGIGTGAGVKIDAGATGIGLDVNATAGSAVDLTTAAGSALLLSGTTHGAEIAASAGPGIEVDGTTFGIQVDASAGAGIYIVGTSTGVGINASAGPGMDIDGTTHGVTVEASAGIGMAIEGTTHGATIEGTAGPGVKIDGTGYGFQVTASAGVGGVFTGTTYGLHLTGTGAAGVAFYVGGVTAGALVSATDGEAIGISGTAHGIKIDASAGPGIEIDATTYGIDVDASAGPGVKISGTTHGLATTASAGIGFYVAGTTFGMDVDASAGSGVRVVGTVNDILADITGNLSGSVGTVAGAVGSVAGNVDGNVTGNVSGNVDGTVASVVGAVGSVAGNVDGNVSGDVAGDVGGDLSGSVVGSLGSLTVAALAQFFTTDSGETYLTSVAGSVVMEIANARAGTGANIFVLTIVDGGAAPIPGASAWISTDAAGTTMVAGPLTTDAAGEVTFLLDDGTYYLWKQMAGYSFTHPESHAVSALALTHTSTGTAVGTAALTQWSINTLSQHLLGFFNQSRTAAGGTTPDRVKNEVRNSLRYIWDVEDWRHEVDIATLALAADGTTIDLPQDYRKAGATVLKDVDDGLELPITESLMKWQRTDDQYEATDTGPPVVAAIIYDTDEDCDWQMKTTPASDKAYSFEFPYYKRCPVDLVAGHADLKGDADSIPMPTAFHKLWEAHAWWQIQEHFGKEDASAKRAQAAYDKTHRAAVDEQNETLSEPTHPSARGYTDGHLFSSGEDGRRDETDRLPED